MHRVLLFVLLVLFNACEKQPIPSSNFQEISQQEAEKIVLGMNVTSQGLSSWNDLREPVGQSLAYATTRPQHQLAVKNDTLQLTWSDICRSLERLQALLPQLDQHPELLSQHFTWYKQTKQPLFTGYYEPTLAASRVAGLDYPYPLYRLPDDLLTVDLGLFHPRWQGHELVYRIEEKEIKPYWDRHAIDRQNVLQNKNLELAWAADETDVFFLQIQGSGRLVYPDGTSQHISYAGKNGRQYVALGRVMKKRGLLAQGEISMQSIRRVLREQPELRGELLDTNPSYIFFRLLDDGPIGALGKKLTPWVSLACDKNILPLGGLMVFSVQLTEKESSPLQGIGLTQDVGGAIKGAHLDLFCGSDARAEDIAGQLQNKGQVWLLVSK